MATTMSDAFREAVALAASAQGDYISLHSGPPGTTGANEITGGTYARQKTTWSGGAVDGIVNGSEVEFAIPATTAVPITVTHIGCHSAATGTGSFKWSRPLSGEGITFPGPGTLKITPRPRIPQGA